MAITNPDFANLTGRMVDPFQPPPPPNVPLPNERHVVDPYEHSRYADIMKHFKDYWGKEADKPHDETFQVSPYDRWRSGQGTLPPIEAGTVNILPGLHGKFPIHYEITHAEAEMLDAMGLLYDEETGRPLYPIPRTYTQPGLGGIYDVTIGETFEHLNTLAEIGSSAIFKGMEKGAENIPWLEQAVDIGSFLGQRDVTIDPETGEYDWTPFIDTDPEVIKMWGDYFQGKSHLNWDELINETSREHEERPIWQQLAMGSVDPTMSLGKGKAAVTAAGFLPFVRKANTIKKVYSGRHADKLNALSVASQEARMISPTPIKQKVDTIRVALKERFTDKFAYTEEATEAAARLWRIEHGGAELPDHMNAALHFSLMSGRPSAVLDESVEVAEKVKGIIGNIDSGVNIIDNFLYYKHLQDVLRMHPNRKIPDVLRREGLSNQEIVARLLAEMEENLGPTKWNQIVEGATLYRNAINGRLRAMIDDGMVDIDLGKRLEKEYPWYNPTYYITDDLAKVADGIKRTVAGGDNGLRYLGEEAGEGLPEDATSVFFKYMARTDELLHRNQAARAFVNMLEYMPEYSKKIKRVKSPVKVVAKDDAGEKIFRAARTPKANQISYLSDGGKMNLFDVLDDDVMHAFRMLEQADPKLYEKIIRFVQAAPRAMLTTYNPIFMTYQFLFDSTIISALEGLTPWSAVMPMLRGWKGIFADDPGMRKLIQAGGDVSGYWGQSSEAVFKALTKDDLGPAILPIKTKEEWWQIFNPVAYPRILKKIGHSIEMAPRRAVFEKELERGKTLPQSVLSARRATVDFSRAGTWMQQLNNWFLYLNPAVQGTLVPYRAVKRNPKRALLGLAGFAGMQVGAYAWNRNFPEYASIPPEQRHRGLMLMTPSDEYDNYGNKVPHGAALLPFARELGLITSPLIYALERMDANENIRQIMPSWMRSEAQVQDDFGTWFKSFGKIANPLSSIVDTGGFIQMPLYFLQQYNEARDNWDSYYGKPIVPDDLVNLPVIEQFNEFTSEVAIRVGKFVGISPMKIDHFIRNGAMRDIIAAADNAIRFFDEDRDPEVDALVAELEEINERFPPQDIKLERNKFFANMSPEMEKKVREGERTPDPAIPFVTSVKNKFLIRHAGAIWDAGGKEAVKVTGANAEQTRSFSIKMNHWYQEEYNPIKYDNDQRYLNYYENPLAVRDVITDPNTGESIDAIHPQVWIYEKRVLDNAAQMQMKGLVSELPQAAQAMGPEGWLAWREAVYTVGSKIDINDPNARVTRGQFISMAYNSIPLYDVLTGELESEMDKGTFKPDWHKFYQMRDDFRAEYPADWIADMDEWNQSTESIVDSHYRKDFEYMKPYLNVKDRIIREVEEKAKGHGNELTVREHLAIHDSYSGMNRTQYKSGDENKGAKEYILTYFDYQEGRTITGPVNIFEYVDTLVAFERDKLRREDPILELLMSHWGIISTPENDYLLDNVLGRVGGQLPPDYSMRNMRMEALALGYEGELIDPLKAWKEEYKNR